MASEFSALLRQLRHSAGMTQEILAERAGVGVRTVRGLETGERADPRVTTVRLLADALGLGPAEREELLAAAVRRTGHRNRPDGSTDHVEPTTGQPAPALYEPLAEVAELLAQSVAARWQREEEQRQVHDPYPLPVRWRPVPEKLIDHWVNVRRLPAGGTHAPLDVSGQLDEIVDVYRRIPSGRLAVLGRAGSGKTILTVRFVLDRLKSRARTEPVPVIFGVGAWDPTAIALRDWLAAQLTRDHPGLTAPGPGGSTLAVALVESGWVLPVLDGFDEIAGGLRRPALEALNSTTLPLLLTSRPAEYAAAVAETDVLTSAAAVELTDLTLDDLADYLPRTTRKSCGGDLAGTAWDPVLTALREQPDDRACADLATVLTTPLMVTLARAVYSDTPGHDPASLLDPRRFGGPEQLEEHLLDNFVTAAYRPRPEHLPRSGPRPDVDPERARYWLGYLADHLSRLGTPNLEWWRLGSGLRRRTRALVTALVTATAVSLTMGLLFWTVGTVVGSWPNVVIQFVNAAAAGLFTGLAMGTTYWFMFAAKDTAVPPSGMRVKVFGGARKAGRSVWFRLLIGLACGVSYGFGYGFVWGMLNCVLLHTGFPESLNISLKDGILFGVVFALGTGPAFGLQALLESPLDIRSAVNPMGLLRTNRRTGIAQFLLWAPGLGLLVGSGASAMMRPMSALLGPIGWNLASSVQVGVTTGLGGVLSYGITCTAFGQWVVFSRIWLPLTGRLPWPVVAFLEDAYQRGVLRQAGAVYQFRHARLQDHLARRYRALRGL
ncbi:helix-turn-helix domain-containing protein [Streptomyces sp. ET3-23]|uniref:helix-turn-helix domain-containing protein n=1 Tax=Streptomyces sp. ET3-23 TaxID=2885643 RepID=UPI001D0F9B62|nr:helix-turn-helix domain-containing protein [Streptomyces sp. ET3-23]MCC2274149.1 helix-turn-helix domain-containing protein [Streptomyces sp. ET3-23]